MTIHSDKYSTLEEKLERAARIIGEDVDGTHECQVCGEINEPDETCETCDDAQNLGR